MKNINKKIICVILVGVLLSSSIITIFCVTRSSRASQEIKTGDSLVAIKDYEVSNDQTGISTYLGYGYNVTEKGYIHENNINASSVDNFIFNMQSNGSKKCIQDTFIKVDNGSRVIDKNYIDARSVESYLKQFNANISKKKFELPGKITSWIPFVSDVYVEVGGQFNKTNTTTSKTAYVKDTMTKKAASITWMLEEEDYYEYLTESFKEDLMELEPKDLFDKYGTHFFRSVILGGKLEYSAKITASSERDLNTATASFKLNVNKESDKAQSTTTNGNRNNNNNNGEDQVSYQDNSRVSNVTIDCTAYCYGGAANSYSDSFSNIARNIANTTLTDLAQDQSSRYGTTDNQADITIDQVGLSTYDEWLRSIDKFPALIDIRDKYSLYAVWDLLDYFPDNNPEISEAEAEERKQVLQEAFNEIGQENYDNIVKKYENETSDSLYTEIETDLSVVHPYSSYDKNHPLKDEYAKINDGTKIGRMYITNAGKTSDGKYMLNDNSFEISYKLEQDPNLLSVGETKYTNHRLISDLNRVSSVPGYGNIFSFWKQFAPRKGGYYVQVVYKNNQTDSCAENNLLGKKNKGDSVKLYTSDISKVETNGGVAEINVLLVYMTETSTNGFFPMEYRWLQEGTIKFE